MRGFSVPKTETLLSEGVQGGLPTPADGDSGVFGVAGDDNGDECFTRIRFRRGAALERCLSRSVFDSVSDGVGPSYAVSTEPSSDTSRRRFPGIKWTEGREGCVCYC